jgi:hypothetical protein
LKSYTYLPYAFHFDKKITTCYTKDAGTKPTQDVLIFICRKADSGDSTANFPDKERKISHPHTLKYHFNPINVYGGLPVESN